MGHNGHERPNLILTIYKWAIVGMKCPNLYNPFIMGLNFIIRIAIWHKMHAVGKNLSGSC